MATSMARPSMPMLIMPAMILSDQKYSRASRMRKPSPLFTAIISDTMTTMNAVPIPIRTPDRMYGTAAGRITRRNMVLPLAPRLRAARR